MLDDLLDLWAESPPDDAGEPIVVAPPSNYALVADLWTERAGERLAESLGQSACESADCFTACFESNPALTASCSDANRQQWFGRLLEQPECAALRAQTVLDVGLSEIAASAIARQWGEYRGKQSQPIDQDNVHQQSQLLRSCRKAAQAAEAEAGEAQDAARAFSVDGDGSGHTDAASIRKVFAQVRGNAG